MGRMMCELMPRTAAFTTSKRRAGYARRSISSSWRAKPNDGSGVPIAADSPSTKMRSVPAGLRTGICAGHGGSAVPAGKNCAQNAGFVVNCVPSTFFTKNVTGSP